MVKHEDDAHATGAAGEATVGAAAHNCRHSPTNDAFFQPHDGRSDAAPLESLCFLCNTSLMIVMERTRA
jgi:hypothetical protein